MEHPDYQNYKGADHGDYDKATREAAKAAAAYKLLEARLPKD